MRPIERIQVFSRDPDKRAVFCRTATEELGIEVVSVLSAEAVLEGAEVLTTITTSPTPVFDGRALHERHIHVNAMGSTMSASDVAGDLAQVVAGIVPGRTSDDRWTLFLSGGTGVEDVSVATKLVELAKAKGVGNRVRIWQELLVHAVTTEVTTSH